MNKRTFSALFGDHHVRELLHGGSLSMFMRIGGAAAAFAVNVVVARCLGAEAAGVFFLAFTLVTVFATFARVGIDRASVRVLAEGKASGSLAVANCYSQSALIIVVMLSLVVTIVVVASSELMSRAIFNMVRLPDALDRMAIAIPPIAVYLMLAGYFQGLGRIAKFQLFQSLGPPVAFLILILVILPGGVESLSLTSISTVMAVSAYTLALLGIFLWFREPEVHLVRAWYSSRQTFALALPMFGVTVLGLATTWMGQITVGVWHSASDVAFFNAAARTSLLLPLVLTAANSVALPKFAALFSQNELAELRRFVIQATRVMTLFCIPIVILVVVYSEPLMRLFGPEFVVAAPSLIILAIAQFINVATGAVAGLLLMTGGEAQALRATAVSAATMIILCLILVPGHGVIGAAFAQAFSIVVNLIVLSYFVQVKFGFVPLNMIQKL